MGPEIPVYLDYHATTPVDERVVAAMLPFFSTRFGNPASRHHFGWAAEAAVAEARGLVAALIGAAAEEIIFTSGATESNNLALKGVMRGERERRHLITVATEHHAVLDPARSLQQEGYRLTVLPVERDGRLDLERLRAAITPETALISVMAANNETGVLQAMAAIGALAHERGLLLHSDCAQAAGKIPVNVAAWGADLISVSGHKIYGPKGVGALYVRRGAVPGLRAEIEGGGQEWGWRSGTLNVPGIVGLGEAARLAAGEMVEESQRLARLRDLLRERLQAAEPEMRINGALEQRLPQNLNVSFPGVDGEMLMMELGADLAVSAGSACTSGAGGGSYVLRAMGMDAELARSALRFGLGRMTTEAEVDFAAGRVVSALRACRGEGVRA
ncbi:MAG: cysteine desulfurase family protein [Terriglobales bacterium]